jgi:hypothetical protein
MHTLPVHPPSEQPRGRLRVGRYVTAIFNVSFEALAVFTQRRSIVGSAGSSTESAEY